MSLVMRSRRVVTPEGERPADLLIEGARIARVAGHGEETGEELIDVGDLVVMPGLVDTHVHVNEPGRTEWEGFETATRAAAAGGITTLVDMPLNSVPPTTTREGLEAKRAAAAGSCWVDVAFWGGAVPDNLDRLDALEGVLGFKCFLAPSGVEEFPHLDPEALLRAMAQAARLGLPLLVHAEVPGPLEEAPLPEEADWGDFRTYLASRPREAENQAVELVVEAAARTGGWAHVLHLSSAEALRTLRQARESGLPITVETCPHYLALSAEDVPRGATQFKCAPPIRERENRERLWEGLQRGLIDQVVSDHSPCPAELKRLEQGDFRLAWGGVSSVQLSLPVTWSAARHRGHNLSDLAEWMAAAPARLAGLEDRKGRIAPGYEADLVVWDPEASFLVEPEELEHRHPVTPYADRILSGVVEKTMLRGAIIYDEGVFEGPRGELLLRGER